MATKPRNYFDICDKSILIERAAVHHFGSSFMTTQNLAAMRKRENMLEKCDIQWPFMDATADPATREISHESTSMLMYRITWHAIRP